VPDPRQTPTSKYTGDRDFAGAFEGETVTRRRFMTLTAHGAGAVATSAFLLPALGFAAGTALFHRPPVEWESVGAPDDFPSDTYVPRVVTEVTGIGQTGKTTIYLRKSTPEDPPPNPNPMPSGTTADFIAVSTRCMHLGCPVRFVEASKKFICPCHADKAGTVPNVPDRPEIGYRAQNALIAHDEDVVIPASATEKIHYEGELVVVIGKKAKHLTEANAMDCVFGYTIGNDVSERTWQKADRSLWRSKNADTFKPMGPWIETDVDLDRMETVIRVNGSETGRFRTNDMIFGIVPFLVELTKYFTLSPGDVIWMGTDGASPNLKAGDVVEIDITGIGTLRNRFVKESV
jgi:2-keto-4-pentenoate hydratase/2-oxohepta-3-ene-1,7-dioic acid hydratase in catechol pathway